MAPPRATKRRFRIAPDRTIHAERKSPKNREPGTLTGLPGSLHERFFEISVLRLRFRDCSRRTNRDRPGKFRVSLRKKSLPRRRNQLPRRGLALTKATRQEEPHPWPAAHNVATTMTRVSKSAWRERLTSSTVSNARFRCWHRNAPIAAAASSAMASNRVTISIAALIAPRKWGRRK